MANEEKYISYYNDMVLENEEDVEKILESASITIYDRFKAKFDDPKIFGSVFSIVYRTIVDHLKSKESSSIAYEINLANRLAIGYSNSADEDDEKMGNFMIYIQNLEGANTSSDFDVELSAAERAVQWKTENIIENPDDIRIISEKALKNLSKIDINLASSEFIMPIFITIYESLILYLKIHRKELDEPEYEMNFISCFNITCYESEDGDIIDIRPTVEDKSGMKDDSKATAVYE